MNDLADVIMGAQRPAPQPIPQPQIALPDPAHMAAAEHFLRERGVQPDAGPESVLAAIENVLLGRGRR